MQWVRIAQWSHVTPSLRKDYHLRRTLLAFRRSARCMHYGWRCIYSSPAGHFIRYAWPIPPHSYSCQQLISWLANDAPRGIGGGVGLLFYFLPEPWVGCLCPDRGCVGDEDSFADFILPPVSCGTVNTRDGDSNTFTSKSEDCCDENKEITSHGTITNFGCCFLSAGHDAAGAGVGIYAKSPLHGWACCKGELLPYSKDICDR